MSKNKSKEIKKFPRFFKGFSYKPYMKGTHIYIEVAKSDNMSKKTVYRVKGDKLIMISTSMPMNMHTEYQKVLNKNIANIIYNLKWYQLLWYRVIRVFRREGNR